MPQVGKAHAIARAFEKECVVITFGRFADEKDKCRMAEGRAGGFADEPTGEGGATRQNNIALAQVFVGGIEEL